MVYVFLTDGFEEAEAIIPVDILRRGGAEVKTVGLSGKMVESSHHVGMTADLLLEEMDLSQTEMIFLPGGMPGTENLKKSKAVDQAIRYCLEHDLWIAAICAGPSVLYEKGLLRGKKVSCHPSVEAKMSEADLSNDPVSLDGKFLTGRGMGAAVPFGLEMCRLLKGRETADQVRQAICYAG